MLGGPHVRRGAVADQRLLAAGARVPVGGWRLDDLGDDLGHLLHSLGTRKLATVGPAVVRVHAEPGGDHAGVDGGHVDLRVVDAQLHAEGGRERVEGVLGSAVRGAEDGEGEPSGASFTSW